MGKKLKTEFFSPLSVKDGKTIRPDLKKKIPWREKNVWKLIEKKFQEKKQKDIFMCQTVTFKESGGKHENIYFISFLNRLAEMFFSTWMFLRCETE